ncbi:MAG: DNA polymerase III subunit beta [Planctomycetes bacterium]|nr:DNA polymerase III subunit beta [Planctomycetota bacterium]
MKFVVAPQTLVSGLNIAAAGAASRTPKPALQGVLLDVQKDEVILSATDLEMGVRVRLTQVEVEREGQVLVPVAKLLQIVRESIDESMVLEVEENTLHIRGSDSHFSMYTGDPAEFPPVSELEGDSDFSITGGTLRLVIDRTLFAAAKESTRYAIDGLLWNFKGDQLKVIATDGRRLALTNAPVQNSSGGQADAIVPAKAMHLISRVVDDPEELFQVKLLSNQLLLRSPRVTVSSVLLEGHFPKYEDVIPQDCDRTVRVAAPAMLSAVRRSALLTSEESKAIRLQFDDNKVVLTGRAPEQGQASVQLPLTYDAEPLEIGFNPNFLVDVLKVFDDQEVRLSLKDANRPGLFRGDNDDFMYVLMPVNLS